MNKKVYGDIIQLFEKLVLNIDVKIIVDVLNFKRFNRIYTWWRNDLMILVDTISDTFPSLLQ